MDDARIGPYLLGPLIGVGGMGEVYRAHDTRRDREVALKLLPESLAHDEEYVARFRRESHAAARLIEPHVIPIHDYGEIDGRLFIDMRLVEGATARELLDDGGRFTPDRTAELVGQVADALAAAHADGLVHRDVKPSNVLVTPAGFAYVVDFGIARSIGTAQPSLTITGVTVGTLDYMAPERFMGADVDGRSDVYSLACLAFEFLTGDRPFRGDDLPSLMYAHLYTEPPAARGTVPELPPDVDAVLARSMAKSVDDRHPDPRTFAAELRAALTAPTAPVPTDAPAPSGEAARLTVSTPNADSFIPADASSHAGAAAAGPAGSEPPSPVDTDRTGPVVLPRTGGPAPAAPSPNGRRAPTAATPGASGAGPPVETTTARPVGAPAADVPVPPADGGPDAGAAADDRRKPGITIRPRILWLTAAAVVVALLVAVGSLTGLLGPATTVEVRLEPVGSTGPNPFLTTPAGVDRTGVTAPASASGQVPGTTPGLYALPADPSACDIPKIVADLRADPTKATAWAAVQRIALIDITTWLTGQNPVTLRADARATEYRYSAGRANAEPVVLQAGTAVLVDEYGAPVVKCTNGNPLAPPAPDAQPPTYAGTPWPDFAETRITIVARAPVPVTTIIVIDPSTDKPTAVPRPDPAPGPGCTRSAGGWTCPPLPDPAAPPAAGCTVDGDMWSCPVTDPSTPPTMDCTRVGETWSCTPEPDPAKPPRAGCTLADGVWTCPRSAAAAAAAEDAATIAAQQGTSGAATPGCTEPAAGGTPAAGCPAGPDPQYGLRPGTPVEPVEPAEPAPGGTSEEPAPAGDTGSEDPAPEPGTSTAPDGGTPDTPGASTSDTP